MSDNDAAMLATKMAPAGYAGGAPRGVAPRPPSSAFSHSDDDNLSVFGDTPQPSTMPPPGIAAGTLPPGFQLPPAGFPLGTQPLPSTLPPPGIVAGTLPPGVQLPPAGFVEPPGVGHVEQARLDRQTRIREANQTRKDAAAAFRAKEKEDAGAAKLTPKGKAGTWLKGAQKMIVDLSGHRSQCVAPLSPDLVNLYAGIFRKRMEEVTVFRNELQALLGNTDDNVDEMVTSKLHDVAVLAASIKTEIKQFQASRRLVMLPAGG